jgi:flagellar hook-associated protein 2
MVTQIQLGNIFSQNGRRVVTGGASGFDVEGLIKGIIDARRQPAVVLEKNMESNTKVAEAFGEMRTALSNFRDAANFLRKPPGVANASDNIFEYRSSSLSATNGATAGNFLSVITKPGAKVTDYQIEVKQLATSNVNVTNTIAVADLDTAVVGVGAGFALQAGALSLGAGGTTVSLSAGDSLAQVVSKINAAKGISGVEADTIKIADGQYRLSLKTVKTGAAQNYSLAASPTFSNIGFAITQSSQDSIINLDGTDIQRSSNSFEDVVKGVAFTLKQVTPVGTKVTAKVEADLEIARTGIVNFVNAYNEFRLFSARQTELGSDGKPLKDSVLASNSTLSLVNSRVSGEIASVVNGILSSSDPDRLADIGIKFSDFPGDDETPFTRNILTIDEDALKEALQTNFDGVRKVFEFDYSANNSNFQIFTRTNDLSISNFTVNITGTTYNATYTDSLGATQTIALDGEVASSGSGVVLKGKSGTPLSGLSMIYGVNGDASINVNISQGLGDRLYNSLDDILKDDTGVLDIELSAMASKEERAKTRISTIDQQLERYREQLLSQFSALERALNSANRLLQTLDAQSNANSNA